MVGGPFREMQRTEVARPRAIPWTVWLQVHFGRPLTQVIWLYLAIVSSLMWLNADYEPRAGGAAIVATLTALAGLFVLNRRHRDETKVLHLLKNGLPARATLVRREPGPRDQGVVLHFEYEHEGQTVRLEVHTRNADRLTDEPTEQLVYDPHRPPHAVLLDDLPVRLDEAGRLRSPSVLRALAVAMAPVLTFGVNIYFVMVTR
jgi:hypothetical protein